MKNKFKVGDRVRIRQWDDMVREFGLTDDGHIPFTKTCSTTFVADMKHLCGRTATITSVNYDTEEVDLDFDDNSGDTNWYFYLGAIEGEKSMDKQERIKELKKQIEEINAEINELERDDTLEQYESDISWGSDRYTLDEFGRVKILEPTIGFNSDEYNPYRHYMTKEYANNAAQMKKFNDMLMAFKWCYDRDYEPDWTTRYAKYYIVYNFDANPNHYCVSWCYTYNLNTIYFSSEDIAQKCVDWLNDIDPNGELMV
jgi:hypothetical protein